MKTNIDCHTQLLNLMRSEAEQACHVGWRNLQMPRPRLSDSISKFFLNIMHQISAAEFSEVDAYMKATERA